MVKYLIHNGADVNVRDLFGFSLLYEVVKLGDSTMIPFLVKHGIDVNVKDPYNKTLLRYAIQSRKSKILNHIWS